MSRPPPVLAFSPRAVAARRTAADLLVPVPSLASVSSEVGRTDGWRSKKPVRPSDQKPPAPSEEVRVDLPHDPCPEPTPPPAPPFAAAPALASALPLPGASPPPTRETLMKPLKLLRSLRRNLWRDVCVRAQTLSPGEVEAWALGRAKLLARKAGLDVEWGSPLGKALEQLLAVLVRELVEEAVELAAVQLEDPHEFAEGLAEALGSLPLLEGPAPASRPDPSRDVTPLSELPAAEAVTMDPLPARPGVVQWIRGRLGLGEGSGAVARARLEALTEREAPTLLDGEA